MQHLHPSSSGSNTTAGTTLFGDRRLCLHNNNHYNHHHHHVALKCPRCESINTKFCYYNNYNLSQPRHFCKNCRRYWTKGGVLRNVPVGEGCRKSSKKRSSSSTTSTKNNNKVTQSKKLFINTNSTNSSDHDSSTSVNVGPITTPGGGAVYDHEHHPNNLEFLFSSSPGGFEPLMCDSSTAENNNLLTFSNPDMQNQGGGVIDPTVRIDHDMLQCSGSNGGLATLDWHDHQGLFDLPSNTLDHQHQDYWNQMTSSHHHHFDNIHNQWSENDNYNNSIVNIDVINDDHTLFLP